jgi:hypothetical protein
MNRRPIRCLAAVILLYALLTGRVVAQSTTASGGPASNPCDGFLGRLGLTGNGPLDPLLQSFIVKSPFSGDLPGQGTFETFCIPDVSSAGSLFATVDFTPANVVTNNGFSNADNSNLAFGIELRRASDNSLITVWAPNQCHPGHAVFGIAPVDVGKPGPVLLRFFNYSPFDVGFTMTLAGPGAADIPFADTSAIPAIACP